MKKTGQNKNRRGGRRKLLVALVSLILMVGAAAIVRMSQQLQAQPAQTAGLLPASTALQQDEQRQRQQQPAAQVPPQDQVPGQAQASQQSQKSPQPSQSLQSPLPPVTQLQPVSARQDSQLSSPQPPQQSQQRQTQKPQLAQSSQSSSGSLPPRETDAEKAARLRWWTDARFGMFIHFGLYALPARHEWVKNHERLTNEQYQKYFDHFNPDSFNPREWARMAKAAGMKYAVITAKHHEGFCLWDSKYTDYKVTNTPFGRDLLKEFVEAFRAEGLKVGFYYSLLDWHHPDYTIDVMHPLRPANEADYDRLNAGKDMNRYRQYMKDQVRSF